MRKCWSDDLRAKKILARGYKTTSNSWGMSVLHVSLEQFEGPLALLLYLIRKEEMDINNIPIHRITSQYLEHIQMMKKLDLEVASEFITMAATLIHIKSKVLLPQYDEELEESLEDPRRDLVKQLVEYQRYQEASKKLLNRPILGRDSWRRGFKEDIVLEENQEIELDESGLFGLISMFRHLIKSAEKRVHRVMKKGQSIASRILEIRDLLVPGNRQVMRELIRKDEDTKNKVLVTFLSLLELAKMGFVHLFQSEPYADIYIETKKIIDRDVIQRVESYDGAEASTAAGEISSYEEQAEQQSLFAQGRHMAENQEDTMNQSATDDEIFEAEKELGFESVEVESIQPTMEPTEEIEVEFEELDNKLDKDFDQTI